MAKVKQFENGIKFFTQGIAVIDVHFPEAEVRCHFCPFCRSEENLERYWCRLTNEMLYNPFSHQRGERCPLVFNVAAVQLIEEGE